MTIDQVAARTMVETEEGELLMVTANQPHDDTVRVLNVRENQIDYIPNDTYVRPLSQRIAA